MPAPKGLSIRNRVRPAVTVAGTVRYLGTLTEIVSPRAVEASTKSLVRNRGRAAYATHMISVVLEMKRRIQNHTQIYERSRGTCVGL